MVPHSYIYIRCIYRYNIYIYLCYCRPGPSGLATQQCWIGYSSSDPSIVPVEYCRLPASLKSLGADEINQCGSVRSIAGCRYIVPVLLPGAYHTGTKQRGITKYCYIATFDVSKCCAFLSHCVSLLRVGSSVQQSSAPRQHVRVLVSFGSCLILEFLLFYLFSIFSQFLFSGWRVCCALVPGTLAFDLPTLIHSRFLFFLWVVPRAKS